MLRILILVVSLLLILGGVIGGLYYWGIDPLAMLGLKTSEFQTKAKAAAAKAAASMPVIPPSYLDFGLLVVPIIQNHEVRAQAEMIIRLQVPANKVDHLATYLPRLQAAFLEDMLEFVPAQMRETGNLEIDPIRVRLLATAQRVFPGEVLDVIIENMVIHQL